MDSAERALVEAAQKDPGRFGALYETHFDRVYAYVVRRLRDRSAAEDVTAEVFRCALAGIGSFEFRGVPFVAWLYRIASNEIADYMTKSGRETPSSAAEPAADQIESIERRASLFRLVDRLPADQRRVIAMRFGEEKSIREVADAIGKSEGAVKQLQWRALQTLRAQMGPDHG